MDFYNGHLMNPLKINKYGIPEPNSKINFPDIILVPLVALIKI